LPNIAYSEAAFQEPLRIRYSSELFRMPTFDEVQQNLVFLNTGQNQTPGLIVMKLDAHGKNYGICKHIVVLFNATNAPVTFTNSQLQGLTLRLHQCSKIPAIPSPGSPRSIRNRERPRCLR
jgi:pullulanase